MIGVWVVNAWFEGSGVTVAAIPVIGYAQDPVRFRRSLHKSVAEERRFRPSVDKIQRTLASYVRRGVGERAGESRQRRRCKSTDSSLIFAQNGPRRKSYEGRDASRAKHEE